MDDHPAIPNPSETASAASKTSPSSSGKRKAFIGVGSILSVILIAGVTYVVLDMTTGKLANETKPAPVVKKVDTPQSLESEIQADIDAEQKLENQTSDSQSQAVVDEVNATQSLEGNYENL